MIVKRKKRKTDWGREGRKRRKNIESFRAFPLPSPPQPLNVLKSPSTQGQNGILQFKCIHHGPSSMVHASFAAQCISRHRRFIFSSAITFFVPLICAHHLSIDVHWRLKLQTTCPRYDSMNVPETVVRFWSVSRNETCVQAHFHSGKADSIENGVWLPSFSRLMFG